MTAKPMKRKVFKVPEKFSEQLNGKELADETIALCKRVEQLAAELGISDECTGFITDGDLSIPWKESFYGEHCGAKWVSCPQLPSSRPCLTHPIEIFSTGYPRILVHKARQCSKKG